MSLSRVLRIALFACAVTVSAGSLSAQQKPAETLKLKKPEMAQFQALSTLVDAVMTGKGQASGDVKLRLRPYFVKSTASVYTPYVLEIGPGKFTSFPLAIYVRAVSRPGPAAAEGKASYPFEDVFFINDAKGLRPGARDVVELSRGLQLPPGEFDVYVAIAETPPRNKSAGFARNIVHTQVVSVPNLSTGFTTSSVMLATALDEAQQQLTGDKQLEEPFLFGGYRITPAPTATFSKAAELLFLFFIYNEAAGPGGKPDVDVNYFFSRAAETKPFSKAATSSFNTGTLPKEFDLNAGHQLVVGQGIPLESFAPGDYKLEIRINDKIANQTITREVPFAVAP